MHALGQGGLAGLCERFNLRHAAAISKHPPAATAPDATAVVAQVRQTKKARYIQS